MYQTSTSLRFWTRSEQDLFEQRNHRHAEFIRVHGAHLDVNIYLLLVDLATTTNYQFQNKQSQQFFLSTYEESLLLRQYELQLREFCRRFEPPMPKFAIGKKHNLTSHYSQHKL